jgi:hypothetical protein
MPARKSNGLEERILAAERLAVSGAMSGTMVAFLWHDRDAGVLSRSPADRIPFTNRRIGS